MDISNYQLGDIYKSRVLLKEYGAPTNDTKNSYQTTASMMGPGNGQANAQDTDPNQFKNQVMFPAGEDDLSNKQKIELLIKFFKKEIDEGKWKGKSKRQFKKFLKFLLGLDPKKEEKPDDDDILDDEEDDYDDEDSSDDGDEEDDEW